MVSPCCCRPRDLRHQQRLSQNCCLLKLSNLSSYWSLYLLVHCFDSCFIYYQAPVARVSLVIGYLTRWIVLSVSYLSQIFTSKGHQLAYCQAMSLMGYALANCLVGLKLQVLKAFTSSFQTQTSQYCLSKTQWLLQRLQNLYHLPSSLILVQIPGCCLPH